jgi:polyisoprenoid-binding protein YceI
MSIDTMTTNLPATGTWTIDPAHTTVGFSVRHLGFSKVRGRFTSFEGQVEVGDDPASSHATVTIDAASFDSSSPDRDAHIRSADFLDADQFPHLTFQSTGVRHVGDDRYVVTGDLTIRGVTHAVELDTVYHGLAQDPWGGTRASFTATTQIDREAWGLTWNQALETGGVLVSKTVTIELEVQVVQA